MNDAAQWNMVIASGCTALFVFASWYSLLGWTMGSGGGVPPDKEEADRRSYLRNASLTYRIFEAMIDGLQSTRVFARRASDAELQRVLDIAGDSPLPFRAQELRAFAFSVAVFGGTGLFLAFLLVTSASAGMETLVMGGLLGMVSAAMCYWTILSGVRQRAEARTRRIVKRLPFALDLVAVALAGSGTRIQALETLLRNEPVRDALVDEFSRLLRLTRELDLPRALQSMKRRLAHPAVDQLVFALVQAEINGAELAEAFRTQASRMLERRFQEGEKLSHEAGVKMVFPGMLIVIACCIITVVPFLFATMVQYSTSGGMSVE